MGEPFDDNQEQAQLDDDTPPPASEHDRDIWDDSDNPDGEQYARPFRTRLLAQMQRTSVAASFGVVALLTAGLAIYVVTQKQDNDQTAAPATAASATDADAAADTADSTGTAATADPGYVPASTVIRSFAQQYKDEQGHLESVRVNAYQPVQGLATPPTNLLVGNDSYDFTTTDCLSSYNPKTDMIVPVGLTVTAQTPSFDTPLSYRYRLATDEYIGSQELDSLTGITIAQQYSDGTQCDDQVKSELGKGTVISKNWEQPATTGTAYKSSALIIFHGFFGPNYPSGIVNLTSNLYLGFQASVNGSGYQSVGYLGDYKDAYFTFIYSGKPSPGTYANICQSMVPLGSYAPKADYGQTKAGDTVWRPMPSLANIIRDNPEYAQVCLSK